MRKVAEEDEEDVVSELGRDLCFGLDGLAGAGWELDGEACGRERMQAEVRRSVFSSSSEKR